MSSQRSSRGGNKVADPKSVYLSRDQQDWFEELKQFISSPEFSVTGFSSEDKLKVIVSQSKSLEAARQKVMKWGEGRDTVDLWNTAGKKTRKVRGQVSERKENDSPRVRGSSARGRDSARGAGKEAARGRDSARDRVSVRGRGRGRGRGGAAIRGRGRVERSTRSVDEARAESSKENTSVAEAQVEPKAKPERVQRRANKPASQGASTWKKAPKAVFTSKTKAQRAQRVNPNVKKTVDTQPEASTEQAKPKVEAEEVAREEVTGEVIGEELVKAVEVEIIPVQQEAEEVVDDMKPVGGEDLIGTEEDDTKPVVAEPSTGLWGERVEQSQKDSTPAKVETVEATVVDEELALEEEEAEVEVEAAEVAAVQIEGVDDSDEEDDDLFGYGPAPVQQAPAATPMQCQDLEKQLVDEAAQREAEQRRLEAEREEENRRQAEEQERLEQARREKEAQEAAERARQEELKQEEERKQREASRNGGFGDLQGYEASLMGAAFEQQNNLKREAASASVPTGFGQQHAKAQGQVPAQGAASGNSQQQMPYSPMYPGPPGFMPHPMYMPYYYPHMYQPHRSGEMGYFEGGYDQGMYGGYKPQQGHAQAMGGHTMGGQGMGGHASNGMGQSMGHGSNMQPQSHSGVHMGGSQGNQGGVSPQAHGGVQHQVSTSTGMASQSQQSAPSGYPYYNWSHQQGGMWNQ